MNDPGPADEQKKNRAAYAAIIPFLLAEIVILVVALTKSEMDRAFFGILFGVNILLAAAFAAAAGAVRKRG